MALSECKFVVIKHEKLGGIEVPLLLPACVSHDAVKAIGEPVSGGYASSVDGVVRTYGESSSLGMVPRVGDAELIQAFFAELIQVNKAAINFPKEKL